MADNTPLVWDAPQGIREMPVGDKVPTNRLGSGTADSTKFLRGDQTWSVPSGGGAVANKGLYDCIIAAQHTTNTPDFIVSGAGALDIKIAASVTDPFEYEIAGTRYTLTADTAELTLPDNSHCFIYIDTTGTLSYAVLNPTLYSFQNPHGQVYWYDLTTGLMKISGTPTPVIAVGYVRTDSGSTVTPFACEAIGLTPWERWSRFGEGRDNFITQAGGSTSYDDVKHYTAFIAYSGAQVTHTLNSKLTIKCQGVFVLLDTSSIDVSGVGSAPGAGSTGAVGAPGTAGGWGGGGGGGGDAVAFAGGEGGAHGHVNKLGLPPGAAPNTTGDDSPFLGNLTAPTAEAMPFLFGAGGGGGGGDGSSTGGNGGYGGGGVNVLAAAIVVGPSAALLATGADGAAGTGPDAGGGGGGGGGLIHLVTRSDQVDGGVAMTVAGGVGGAAAGSGTAGGAGGSGRVLLTRI